MIKFRCCVATALCSLVGAVHAADDSQQLEFFETKIRPVLIQQCYKCHSVEAQQKGKLKGGLLLDDRAGIRRGGESGAAVVPGNPKNSLLLSALRHDGLEMPPNGKLPATVIEDFAKWIKTGATDPRDGKGVIRRTIDLKQGRNFWSFQPVKKHPAPKVQAAAWSDAEIDRFVAQRFEQKGLKPVEQTSAAQLVRRVHFDLLGLPPSPSQLDVWVGKLGTADRNKRAAALKELVDALLATPQFGERWGRHWLDVARYAESNGNSRNATFPHAWRYRDYVIDALNADTPFDQFLTQQVAGDLLPHKNADERNRNLIATGFLAIGSKPVIRGKKGGFVPDIAADQIEVTSRAILGLTVACARCHDHKFDPIPTTDYYGLAGIFASSETLYGGGGNAMGGAPATALHVLTDKDPKKAVAYKKWKAAVADLTKQQQAVNAQLKKLGPKRRKNRKAAKQAAKVAQPADNSQKEKLAELQKERTRLTAALKKLQAKRVQPPGSAMGIREAAKVLEVPIYVRGESPKGGPINRRLISVATTESIEFPSNASGRLELARWLTSAQQPLTSRVIVNRIWQHLFGEGIVRTPDNFGVNGDRPTHPELLDHLAATFIEDGWSIKRMIRRIVLTRAYQLADTHDEANYQIDPENMFLWRHSRRRLEAEAIRDSILAVSGQLELDRPSGSVVTVHSGKLIQDALTPDKIHRPSNHRSVYLPILRNGLPESLEVFDLADPSLVVGRRSVTIVPAQDLFLMNSPFVVEKSKNFATRVLKNAKGNQERVTAAYRLALSREPSAAELDRALQFIRQASQSLSDQSAESTLELTAWAGFCQALFVSSEFRHTR